MRQVCEADSGTGWKQESAQEPTSSQERHRLNLCLADLTICLQVDYDMPNLTLVPS